MHKHASLVTKITTLFMWFFILSLTAESMASFTPADLILCHLNTNLLHLKCAMIPDYLTARWNHNQKKKGPSWTQMQAGKKKKKTALPFMHICNIGSMQGIETSATAASADMLKQAPMSTATRHWEASGCVSSAPNVPTFSPYSSLHQKHHISRRIWM